MENQDEQLEMDWKQDLARRFYLVKRNQDWVTSLKCPICEYCPLSQGHNGSQLRREHFPSLKPKFKTPGVTRVATSGPTQ